MKSPRMSLVTLSAAVYVMGLLSGCVGDSATSPPRQGGKKNQPYSCAV